MREDRELGDLVSVGPATLEDLRVLGVESVEALAECDPIDLYESLSAIQGCRVDRCVEDVFRAAVAQARDPKLPAEKRQWWYWSRVRKTREIGT